MRARPVSLSVVVTCGVVMGDDWDKLANGDDLYHFEVLGDGTCSRSSPR